MSTEGGGASASSNASQLNEDAYLVHDGLGLYVVADGASGGPAGEVAARTAVTSLEQFVQRAGTDSLASLFHSSWPRVRRPKYVQSGGEVGLDCANIVRVGSSTESRSLRTWGQALTRHCMFQFGLASGRRTRRIWPLCARSRRFTETLDVGGARTGCRCGLFLHRLPTAE